MTGMPQALAADAEARGVWLPPPKLTISQWADQSRMLSPEASAEPGRWDTARAEYQRSIMDAASDPDVAVLVLKTSSQVGKTEILNNVVGFHIEHSPAPILVLLPTVEIGEAWSKDRLAPMIRDTPVLRDRVSSVKSRDGGNTLRHKSFAGGHLTIAGANSAASLASRPIRVLLCDEVDRYPASAGTEGDPVDLATRRTANYWNSLVVLASTPLIAGTSRIDAAYLASDQRHFWVPCPDCGQSQTLRWEQVRWEADDAASALYHCDGCGAAWTDAQRWAAVRLGYWKADAPFKGTAGFALSELYSPWRKLAQTVADFLAAKGSPDRLKTWKNTALGETWHEQGEAPEWERLFERREPFPMGVVPDRAIVLTGAVDNQASPARLEVAIWAWAPGYESWLIDTVAIDGSPGASATWDTARKVFDRTYPREGGGSLRIVRVGVDTGGSDTSGVYAQLRRLRDPRIVPIKGVSGWNRASPVNGPTFVDVTVSGKKIPKGLKLWTVAVDVFKAELYRRLWLNRAEDGSYPPGWVHLPDGLDAERVKQLVAEQLVTVRDRRGFSRQEWQKTRANEQLDLNIYARAALSVLGSDRYGDRFWKRVLEVYPVTDADPEPQAPAPEPVLVTSVPTPEPAPPTVQQRSEGVTITNLEPNSPEARRARRLERLVGS